MRGGLMARAAMMLAAVWLAACASTQTQPQGPPPVQRFTGIYYQNFELRGFRPDGHEGAWWVSASEAAWGQLFAGTPDGFVPPPMGFEIEVEVDARLSEPGRYGHLGSFPRAIHFERVLEAHPLPVACEPVEAVVYFGSNETAVNAAGAEQIERIVEHMRTRFCNVSAVQLTGFTDTTGSAAYNQALSERRAEAVRDMMVAVGMHADVFSVEGAGETALMRPTDDNVSEAMNRGVRIRIEAPRTAVRERAAPQTAAETEAVMQRETLVETPPAMTPALERRAFSPPNRWRPDQRAIVATAADRAWFKRRR